MLLGDTNIEVTLWNFLLEDIQLGAAGHGSGDGGNGFVFFGKIGDGTTIEFGVGGVVGSCC